MLETLKYTANAIPQLFINYFFMINLFVFNVRYSTHYLYYFLFEVHSTFF